jgi:hypothetical protein
VSPYVFPVTNERTDDKGITLRDYFAGQALAGLLSCDDKRGYSYVAKDCYSYADAVLKMRGEK